MCRVAVRQAPRQRAEEAVKLEPAPMGQLYAELQRFPSAGLNDEYDFDSLFDDGEELGEQAVGELDLMALFADDTGSPSTTSQQQPQAQQQPSLQPAAPQQSAAAAYGVPVQQPVAAVPVMQPAAQTVQQLQLQAIMQQQMAQAQQQHTVQSTAYAASGIPPAQLQQIQAAQLQQAMLAAQANALRQHGAPVNKRGKTQAEVEEQQERIKKRRRESAQRSRARKNSYMKTLEVENKALKMENERLRMELMKLTGKAGTSSSSKPETPSQHMALSGHTQSEVLSLSDDGGCNQGASMEMGGFFPLTL